MGVKAFLPDVTKRHTVGKRLFCYLFKTRLWISSTRIINLDKLGSVSEVLLIHKIIKDQKKRTFRFHYLFDY